MPELDTKAREARASLGKALATLSGDALPPNLFDIATPVAKAMSVLYRAEKQGGHILLAEGDALLGWLREALGTLQIDLQQSSAEEALAAVAAALNICHSAIRSEKESAEQLQAAEAARIAAEAQAAETARIAAEAQTAETARIAAEAQAANTQGSETAKTLAGTVIEVVEKAPKITVVADTDHSFEAFLAANRECNFYKGFTGNDIFDSGGLFVTAPKPPKIGEAVQLKLHLPGGFEFEAQGTVQWTRQGSSSGSSAGFGAKLHGVDAEERQLVYRFVRNREPLFYDDL